jgi:hypothetical protein
MLVLLVDGNPNFIGWTAFNVLCIICILAGLGVIVAEIGKRARDR